LWFAIIIATTIKRSR